MRQIIRFKGTSQTIPFDNNNLIKSYIHKCLGDNNKYHNTISNYSISSLCGGKINSDKSGLDFSDGGYFVITSLDNEFNIAIMKGIIKNQKMFNGIELDFFDDITEKFYDGWNHFVTLSPFIVKKYNDDKYTFATVKDDDFEDIVEKQLKSKLKKIFGVDAELKVEINQPIGKTKFIKVNNCVNIANHCHVSVFCDNKIAEMIYNVGIGQSCGIGFGTVYYTSNHHLYRN